jgi:MYXO-CTERM domain-containing protein
MKSRALNRALPVLALLLAAIMTVTAIPMALAQAPTTPPGQSPQTNLPDTRDDSSGEWGLAGLIGLLGLAGLMRRDRTRPIERPAERVGRP